MSIELYKPKTQIILIFHLYYKNKIICVLDLIDTF
jgi:hypothetical protein